jgi:DNA-binding CsgD family transcriptional regulator
MRLCHLGLLRLYKTRRAAGERNSALARLTPRIAQTLELLLAGNTLKQIAAQLGISAHTVNDYVKLLYRRLDVSSRGELLSKCLLHRPPPMLALPPGMPHPTLPAAARDN